jgi:hypothetical protein
MKICRVLATNIRCILATMCMGGAVALFLLSYAPPAFG